MSVRVTRLGVAGEVAVRRVEVPAEGGFRRGEEHFVAIALHQQGNDVVEQLPTEPFRCIPGQLAGEVVHGHDGGCSRRIESDFALGLRVVAVEGLGDGRSTQGAGHGAVDIAADVRHYADAPVRSPHVLAGEEEGRAFAPKMARDVQVCMDRIVHEGAPELGRIRDEFRERKPAVEPVGIVVVHVQVGIDRLRESPADEVVLVHFADPERIEDFLRPAADPPKPRQQDGEVAGQLDVLAAHFEHFRKSSGIDGAGQGVPAGLEPVGPESVVGTHEPCPTPESDDALAARAAKQLVVNQADAVAQDGREQRRIVGLKLVGVAEEEVGLLRNQLSDGHFLDPEEDVAVAEVFLQRNAGRGVLGIGDAAHGAGLDDDVELRIAAAEFLDLGRGEGHALVRRHLAFAQDAEPQGVVRGVGQNKKG